MTEQTIVAALHELAQLSEDGYETLIQDGGSEPTPISVVIDNEQADGEDLPISDWAVSTDGITQIKPDGYLESIPVYRVIDGGQHLRDQIYAWTPKRHVEELRDLVVEYNRYVDTHDQHERQDQPIDFDIIRSADVPEDITSYPVWVADNNGNALVGAIAEDVEPLADVIEHYRAQRAETIADAKENQRNIDDQIRRESLEV
jgi:hypothetical protein